jgi:hypothetical protein
VTLGRAIRLARVDVRRSWRRLAGAAGAIALAVAALVFLLALGLGVRRTLLGDVFPLDRLEVAAEGRSLDLFAVRLPLGGDTLSPDIVDRLEELPGVRRVYPKMKLVVPAVVSGGGWLLGSALQTELVIDGIDPDLVADEVGAAFRPVDRLPSSCRGDRDCGPDGYCVGASAAVAGACRAYVPALISPQLLELYNGSLRRVYRLPKLDPEALEGVTGELTIGASMLKPGQRRALTRERVRLVGISDRAIPLGLTLPLSVVRDLNVRFSSPGAADEYHSAILELSSPDSAPAVIEAAESMGLVVSDRGARRTADALSLLLAIAAAVGAALLAVAVLSVVHAFYLAIADRRHELAVLRALGATRSDLRGMVVAEAILVGAAAGVAGVAVAAGAAALFDRIARTWVPDFPYRPDSFFSLEPALLVGAVAIAVAAAVIGALPAVQRAAAADPSEGLTAS